MLEKAAMILVGTLISLTLAIYIAVECVVFVRHNQAIDMQQYVNYEIERFGGLTSGAMNNINTYMDQNYGSKVFTIQSEDGNGQKPYGTLVTYRITASLKVPISNVPNQPIDVPGSALSLIR